MYIYYTSTKTKANIHDCHNAAKKTIQGVITLNICSFFTKLNRYIIHIRIIVKDTEHIWHCISDIYVVWTIHRLTCSGGNSHCRRWRPGRRRQDDTRTGSRTRAAAGWEAVLPGRPAPSGGRKMEAAAPVLLSAQLDHRCLTVAHHQTRHVVMMKGRSEKDHWN